jgi:hypothetical protein
MSRAVVALALLVAAVTALQIAGALRMNDGPAINCSFCHD